MKIIKPLKLISGDTIGIVASSLPVLPSFRENYERGKRVINDLGFKIKEGKTIGKTRWWAAGTPKEVATDINNMFADKSIKAIMAQTGGYSAVSVLEYLDYELISENPKPFIGMSDVTNYLLAFLTKCGIVGFHMDDVLNFNENFFLKFLAETNPPGIIKPISEWEEWKKGSAQGPLIGGNLHLFTDLMSTPYFPSKEYFDGAILFWEDVGESVYMFVRLLTYLKYAGILDRISGMLIGKTAFIKPMREKEIIVPDVKEAILDTLKGYKFPIMANMDFGHFTVNIPMPIGIKVFFDTTKKELNFLESAVS